ncbi:hypothetical protein AAVH_33259 [Aphelenchoides avenae]|nr:hypothetical protein AAVH_33259 [Aphelenchus avenae]
MDPSVATTSAASPSWAVYYQPGQPSSTGHFTFASDSSVSMGRWTRMDRPCDLAERTILVYRPQTSTSAQQSEPAFFRDWLKANFNVPNEAVHEVRVVGVENYRVAMMLLDEQKTLENVYEMYKSSNQQFARIGCYVQKATDALLEGGFSS